MLKEETPADRAVEYGVLDVNLNPILFNALCGWTERHAIDDGLICLYRQWSVYIPFHISNWNCLHPTRVEEPVSLLRTGFGSWQKGQNYNG